MNGRFLTDIQNSNQKGYFNSKITLKQLSILTTEFSELFLLIPFIKQNFVCT